MNKILFSVFAILFFTNSFSQVLFEKGYFINNENETINCLIKNVDWKNNPEKFDYRLSESSEIKTLTIDLVKEFSVNNFSKYIRAKVDIDRSSKNMSRLSKIFSPQFQKEMLFLKVLIEGNSSLFYYEDGNLIRFFYRTNNNKIEQLIYKSYINNQNYVNYNNSFRKQLSDNLNCKNTINSDYKSLTYTKKELTNVFIKNNTCNDSTYKDFTLKGEKIKLNFSLKARGINNSFETEVTRQQVNFGNKTTIGFGFEIESIFPFNKNKWAVLVEPSFQSYKSEVTVETPGSIRDRALSIDYKSVELAVGARHYLFLNSNSKFFINAFWIVDFPMNSVLTSTRGTSESEFGRVKNSSNLAFGIGYKYKDKYSAEFRSYGSRSILGNEFDSYRSTSLVLGYTIF